MGEVIHRAEADYKLAQYRAREDFDIAKNIATSNYELAVKRATDARAVSEQRAKEDFCNRMLDLARDDLARMRSNYRFYDEQWSEIHATIMQQLNRVLYTLKDFNHVAIQELKRGCFDWCAAPYWKGEQSRISLSQALYEYTQHYNGMLDTMPSSYTQQLMYITTTSSTAHEASDLVCSYANERDRYGEHGERSHAVKRDAASEWDEEELDREREEAHPKRQRV